MNGSTNSNNRDFVVVGEEIRYYVNISANVDPSSVIIDGKTATRSGSFNGEAVSNTTWYITWSKDTKGIYPMSVSAVIDNDSFSQQLAEEGNITVYGLIRGNSTTSPNTTGATLYLLQNNNYTSTYLTAVNSTLAANNSMNYYNLFTIDGKNIRSVARDAELSGTNGSVSFTTNGTSYNITSSGNSLRISYSSGLRTYNLRQTNSTTVQISTSTSNRNWTAYAVSYDIP
jgi:hypothetical protein